jgi:hypothetical protein
MPRPRRRDPISGKFRKQGQFNNPYVGSTLERGIAQFDIKLREEFHDILEPYIDEMVDYAKANAPWSDRTGDARAGLSASFEEGARDVWVLTLFHTVEYGVWLEIRWGGKYAIIMPTAEVVGSRMMDALKRMLDRIVFYE